MRHPWFVAALLAVAAFAGYGVGSRPVQAQSESWPMAIGELVTLTFPGGSTRQCAVEQFKGATCAAGPGSVTR
jgi:hypothetical protein